ncbi:hypothetical protein [Actinomadura rugatobispora]|uniref:Uncharacterized protein n=1 Tax=Actinomadura rugatobispora TaxID=1994 RepID=A0ABW1A8X4_9ACTN|nr:hypothetical protein GCM10010200_047880 [Actinomadura rugatobispora]
MANAPTANEARGDSVVLGDLCPGWHTERTGGRLVARRLAKLSDYQLGHGCLGEITVSAVGELVILCDAHNLLAERVALAEAIVQVSERNSPWRS